MHTLRVPAEFPLGLARSPPILPNCILGATHYEQVSHRMMFIATDYWLEIEEYRGWSRDGLHGRDKPTGFGSCLYSPYIHGIPFCF
jgi:hypothetical protein